MTDAPLLWEQQEKESAKAYEAFAVYRDQAQRSIREVGRTLGKSGTLMSDWSAKHSWVVRATAWDLHQDRIKLDAADEAVRQMSVRHATLAQIGLQKVALRIQQMNPDEIPAGQLGSTLRHLSDVERRARGVNDRIEVALLTDSPEWQRIRSDVLTALLPHPEALMDVLAALGGKRR